MSQTLISPLVGPVGEAQTLQARSHARPLLFPVTCAAALLIPCVYATSEAWRDLWTIGVNDEESSHVWLVPVMVIWLVWSRRRAYQVRSGGRMPGALVLVAGWALWRMGYDRQIQYFWHAGAVLMAVGCVFVGMGSSLCRAFWPALLALTFLVPIPHTGRQLFALPLQRLTAEITQVVAETLGMDVMRRSNLLSVNNVDVAVVEACNGMRMVFTLLLSCYVFVFVTPLRPYVRITLLILSPVVAVVCNVLRLVPTVWMFGHASPGVAKQFHDLSGWAMLILAFLGLQAVVRLLRWVGLRVDAPIVTPGSSPSGGTSAR